MVVTDFVSERTCLKEHLNLGKSGFDSEEGHSGCKSQNIAIEGFGGKRAVGILRKIELCQKRSKFRMQFCLGVLNNILHVFSLKLASFLRYYVCKKTHFSEGIL